MTPDKTRKQQVNRSQKNNSSTAGNNLGKTLFQKGQSGNPQGRPKGSLNKTTLAVQNLLNGQAEEITQKAIELAIDGDGPALKLCFERLLPVKKDAPVT